MEVVEKKKELVPVLRFREFKDAWPLVKVQKLLDDKVIISHLDGNHGGLYPRNEEFTKEGVPYITANDFISGRVHFDNCKRLPEERAKQFKKGVAKNNDVLFAHNATVGPTAILNTDLDYVILSTTATYYRCDLEKLNNNYLRTVFQSDNYIRQYSRVMSQSTRNQVPITIQRTFKVPFPTLPEQQKIAAFLSAVDEKIQQLRQKKALLEKYKKGVMQKLFPKKAGQAPELRFKKPDGSNYPDWSSEKIGSLIIKHDEKSEYSNQYPVLTSSRHGIYFQKDYFDGNDVASKDNTGYNVVPKGFFTYRHMSDDLVFKFNINTLCEKGIVSTLYPVFTTNDKVDSEFLKILLNEGNDFKRFAILQKQGGSRTYMYLSKLSNLVVDIPDMEEQNIIVNFLSGIDQKINQVETQINQTQTFKKGLLQQMFV